MENPTVADRLRTIKPHHLLVAVEGEDEPRRLAVPNVRNRWQRIDAVLAQLRWTTIDARDKSGGTLAMLQAESDDVPPPALSSSAAGAGVTIRERDLVELTMSAYDRGARAAQESADRALGRAERSLTMVAESITAQLEMMTQATRAVVGQYSEALTLQRTLTAGPAAAAGEDEGALPALLAMMARGTVVAPPPKVAPPKNGAPPAKEKAARR